MTSPLCPTVGRFRALVCARTLVALLIALATHLCMAQNVWWCRADTTANVIYYSALFTLETKEAQRPYEFNTEIIKGFRQAMINGNIAKMNGADMEDVQDGARVFSIICENRESAAESTKLLDEDVGYWKGSDNKVVMTDILPDLAVRQAAVRAAIPLKPLRSGGNTPQSPASGGNSQGADTGSQAKPLNCGPLNYSSSLLSKTGFRDSVGDQGKAASIW